MTENTPKNNNNTKIFCLKTQEIINIKILILAKKNTDILCVTSCQEIIFTKLITKSENIFIIKQEKIQDFEIFKNTVKQPEYCDDIFVIQITENIQKETDYYNCVCFILCTMYFKDIQVVQQII